MMSIAIDVKCPDLFAASFLVAGQWDPAKVLPCRTTSCGVRRMLADGSNIEYVVLRRGIVVPSGMKDDAGSNHVCTWRIAYATEGVRDW